MIPKRAFFTLITGTPVIQPSTSTPKLFTRLTNILSNIIAFTNPSLMNLFNIKKKGDL